MLGFIGAVKMTEALSSGRLEDGFLVRVEIVVIGHYSKM